MNVFEYKGHKVEIRKQLLPLDTVAYDVYIDGHKREWASKLTMAERLAELYIDSEEADKGWKRIPSAPGYENVPTYLKDSEEGGK